MSETIHVLAPSRLHFGMFSFGQPEARAYGGLGMMLDQPGLRLTISAADSFTVDGPHAERAQNVVEVVARAWKQSELPRCKILIESAPQAHIGLGLGTQLALALASGITRFVGQTVGSPFELAGQIGRASRSAVGTYGFELGGLIVEAGRFLDEPCANSPLVCRHKIPEAWRFVLFCPRAKQGLFGTDEKQAFDRLSPIPLETTEKLCQLALLEIVPAVSGDDFPRFSRAVYQFGSLAGNCFTSVQGGPFASDSVACLIERLRRHHVEGVGQTSWGPTVFAVQPDEKSSNQLFERFKSYAEANDWTMTLASPCNYGARIEPFPLSITS